MNPVIQDGYTFTATLEQIGPWEPPTIRYRPALPEDVMEFLYQRDLAHGRAKIKPVVDFMKRHLIGWDNRNAQGEIMPITEENLRRLHIGYQNQILDHLMGYAKAEVQADAKNSGSASG